MPALVVPAEEAVDMRAALLRNRAEAELVHEKCAATHLGILRAVGVKPIAGK